MVRELPPSAGLPLRWRDLWPGRRDFAQQLSQRLRLPAPQLECSGTAALLLALLALGARSPRRDVVIPAWSCPRVVWAILQAGMRPRLCDLTPNHYDIDPRELTRLVNSDTLAVMPTHLAGRVADVPTILEVARRHGAYVIEDAAQALGARQHGESVGLLGDLGFFSLAAGKGLTTFEGGILISRDETLRTELLRARDKLIQPDQRMEWRRCLQLFGYAALYRPSLLGLVYGWRRHALARDDLIAAAGSDGFGPRLPLHPLGRWRHAVGARALQRLPCFIRATRRQALLRLERLRQLPGVTVYGDPAGCQGVWPSLLLTLPDQASRDRALSRLGRAGLGVGRMFVHALPDYPYLRGRIDDAPLPNARDFAARSLTIGNSLWLDESSFEHIRRQLQSELEA